MIKLWERMFGETRRTRRINKLEGDIYDLWQYLKKEANERTQGDNFLAERLCTILDNPSIKAKKDVA